MKFDFKNIHIGECIRVKAEELGLSMHRIRNYHKVTEQEIHEMYHQKSMDTEILLKWSKLLEYDFFRIYAQHLILYAPENRVQTNASKSNMSSLPKFRKNIYTFQVIDFILELINTGQKTRLQVIEEYRIPKATLCKWISKYDKKDEFKKSI